MIVSYRHQVLAAELERIHSHHPCAVLRVAFERVTGLRHSVASHRSRDRTVRVDRPGLSVDVVAWIELREGVEALCRDRVAVRAVRSVVAPRLDGAGREASVRSHPRCDMVSDRVPDAVADEGLFARDVELHQASS